jgi:hypothetical protein
MRAARPPRRRHTLPVKSEMAAEVRGAQALRVRRAPSSPLFQRPAAPSAPVPFFFFSPSPRPSRQFRARNVAIEYARQQNGSA